MKFTYKGSNGISIEFEDTDTDSEKRMVEQGVAFIKNILSKIKEVEQEVKSHGTETTTKATK